MRANLTMIICFKMKECKLGLPCNTSDFNNEKNSLTAMNHVFIPNVLAKYNHEFS